MDASWRARRRPSALPRRAAHGTGCSRGSGNFCPMRRPDDELPFQRFASLDHPVHPLACSNHEGSRSVALVAGYFCRLPRCRGFHGLFRLRGGEGRRRERRIDRRIHQRERRRWSTGRRGRGRYFRRRHGERRREQQQQQRAPWCGRSDGWRWLPRRRRRRVHRRGRVHGQRREHLPAGDPPDRRQGVLLEQQRQCGQWLRL
jgi:hypothetical protein